MKKTIKAKPAAVKTPKGKVYEFGPAPGGFFFWRVGGPPQGPWLTLPEARARAEYAAYHDKATVRRAA